MDTLKEEIQLELKAQYKVLERIGQGGMAAVYKIAAHDGTLYALKVLHPHLTESDVMVTRFLKEARNSIQIRSPNCINVIQSGKAGQFPYFIMEYIEGEDLAKVLKNRRFLSPPEAKKIFRQICNGIEAAHEIPLVHRDIKPANILIEKDTQRAVITDFGIARAADGTKLTITGSCMGTPAYMSPEQAEGSKNIDYRSDIYSLGVLLYEICTGGMPFQRDSEISLANARLNEAPIPPRHYQPDLPKKIEAVILQAMAFNPSSRYASATALAQAFEEAVDSPTPSNGVYVTSSGGFDNGKCQDQQKPGIKRNNIILIGVGTAAVALVAVLLTIIILLGNKNHPPQKWPTYTGLASQRPLTEMDLYSLSITELKILRNEVYARYGCESLDSREMIDYFNNRQWYQPNPDYYLGMLSQMEKNNINLIRKFERIKQSEDRGYRQPPTHSSQRRQETIEVPYRRTPVGYYAVQISSPTNPNKAEQMVRNLIANGFDAFVQIYDADDGKRHYRVRVGMFSKKSEAENTKERLIHRGLAGNNAYTTIGKLSD